MTQREPDGPYVYQPGRAFGDRDPRSQKIWGVAGRGTEDFQGLSFTRAEADEIVDTIILSGVGMMQSFLPPGFEFKE